jgi:ATP-dependent Clp protease ATP-binding subunit ClpC
MEDLSQLMSRLSENARFALQKADYYSKKYSNGYMGTEHMLLGILAQDSSTGARFLLDAGVTLDDAEKALGGTPTDVPQAPMAMMSLSDSALLTLRMAHNFTEEAGLQIIGTEHLLYALVRQPNSRANTVLAKLKIDLQAITNNIEAYVEKQSEEEKINAAKRKAGKIAQHRFLGRFASELTARARDGKLDTVIGRDAEIERAITILSRRTKSNPVLIGEPGVGKTAIVEGLATRIVKNDVPSLLVGKKIFLLDLALVVAGTKFRGEFEERIKGIIDEAIADPSVILFIDELHLLAGAGSSEGSMDAANILKPALARGELHLIGATTLDEYRKYIEKDKALSRRLQTIMVDEPSLPVSLRILRGIRPHYEQHHSVKLSDDILEQAIYLSDRYINDRFLPDKAIDIIDEASAIAKVAADKNGGGEYKKLRIERSELEAKIEDCVNQEDYEKAALYKQRLAVVEDKLKALESKNLDAPAEVTFAQLAQAVSLRTGIPVHKVEKDEAKLLIKLEDHLRKSIIGQEEAVVSVARAIRRGRSGITDPKRPIGSFLFMGPTGVGKTELARVIAHEVYGTDQALIKIDMSEFEERHNAARLVGAPAGYIGYEDGGKLTEQVRRHPYSVVLFDEIEKAHPDVLNLLLQILEDGTLTDGQGNRVKFNHTIIILTSNLGADQMFREAELGFAAHSAATDRDLANEHEQNKLYAMKALKKVMRPELINRLDSIVVFHALTRQEVGQIFDNLIANLTQRLAYKNLGLQVSESAKNYLIDRGFDPQNGARPLRRVIEDQLESLISEKIIASKIKPGQTLSATVRKDQLVVTTTKE